MLWPTCLIVCIHMYQTLETKHEYALCRRNYVRTVESGNSKLAFFITNERFLQFRDYRLYTLYKLCLTLQFTIWRFHCTCFMHARCSLLGFVMVMVLNYTYVPDLIWKTFISKTWNQKKNQWQGILDNNDSENLYFSVFPWIGCAREACFDLAMNSWVFKLLLVTIL